MPSNHASGTKTGGESVQVACLLPSSDYEDSQSRPESFSWLRSLCMNTKELLADGWSSPPVLAWVDYKRKKAPFKRQASGPSHLNGIVTGWPNMHCIQRSCHRFRALFLLLSAYAPILWASTRRLKAMNQPRCPSCLAEKTRMESLLTDTTCVFSAAG